MLGNDGLCIGQFDGFYRTFVRVFFIFAISLHISSIGVVLAQGGWSRRKWSDIGRYGRNWGCACIKERMSKCVQSHTQTDRFLSVLRCLYGDYVNAIEQYIDISNDMCVFLCDASRIQCGFPATGCSHTVVVIAAVVCYLFVVNRARIFCSRLANTS